MAIIVSIISFKISDRQYQLSYFESRPDFIIQKSEVKNDSSCYIEAYNLIIKKSGGKAKNMNIRTAAFLSLKIIQKNWVENWKRKLIFNYYSGGPDSIKNDENTYMLYGYDNNRNFVNLWHTVNSELEDSVYKNKYWHCEARLKEYIEISYLNFENEIFTEYYEIKLGQGYLIEPEIGIQAFYDYDKQFFLSKAIWLDNIATMDVKKILKELFEMEDYIPSEEDKFFNEKRDKKYRDIFREEYGSKRDSLGLNSLILSKE